MIILGLDPGLGTTGWGLIRAEGNRLSHLANGRLKTDSGAAATAAGASRCDARALIADHAPEAAAVEEVFVNSNAQSTLKLGQARGVVLCAAARTGIDVGEYAAEHGQEGGGRHRQCRQGAGPCDGRRGCCPV
jgi:crossover junction endodeoxyribonuclease RuvC